VVKTNDEPSRYFLEMAPVNLFYSTLGTIIIVINHECPLGIRHLSNRTIIPHPGNTAYTPFQTQPLQQSIAPHNTLILQNNGFNQENHSKEPGG